MINISNNDIKIILKKYKAYISIIIPIFLNYLIWIYFMIVNNQLPLFIEYYDNKKPGWYFAILIFFVSMINGITIGGGSINLAFPSISLLLQISPSITKEFSYMIQAISMTSVSFTLFYLKFPLEYFTLFYCSFGGILGVIFSLEIINNSENSYEYYQMSFACIWFTFGIIYFAYRNIVLKFNEIYDWENKNLFRIILPFKLFNCSLDISINTYGLLLTGIGFLGGILSSLTGSGIDLCCFAVLIFYFRIKRNIALSTSIAVLSIISIFQYYYYQFRIGGINQEAYSLCLLSIPMVIISLPISVIITMQYINIKAHSLMILILNTGQFVGIMFSLATTWNSFNYIGIGSVIEIFCSFLLFYILVLNGNSFYKSCNNHAEGVINEKIDDIMPFNIEDSSLDDHTISVTDINRKLADAYIDDQGNWIMTLPSSSPTTMVNYEDIYDCIGSPKVLKYKGSPIVLYDEIYKSDNNNKTSNSPSFHFDQKDI